MDIQYTLHKLYHEANAMAFSWYLRKGQVPFILKNIIDVTQKCLDLAGYLQNKSTFNFICAIANGKTLLVGEGNFSFTLSFVKNDKIQSYNLTATTSELQSHVTDGTLVNAREIQQAGGTVLFGVDATKLETVFNTQKFDNIVFQFPHAGTREPVSGHNPNLVLIKNFLKSAACQLMPYGQVLISAVNNPHYHGAFQFDKAAEFTGFAPPDVYPFDPTEFQGYTHTMTHQDGSALDHHETFSTWVFKLKL